jgi:hypothetical protein
MKYAVAVEVLEFEAVILAAGARAERDVEERRRIEARVEEIRSGVRRLKRADLEDTE